MNAIMGLALGDIRTLLVELRLPRQSQPASQPGLLKEEEEEGGATGLWCHHREAPLATMFPNLLPLVRCIPERKQTFIQRS